MFVVVVVIVIVIVVIVGISDMYCLGHGWDSAGLCAVFVGKQNTKVTT